MQNIFMFLFLIVSQISCAQLAGDKPQQIVDILLPEGDGVRVNVWIDNLES